MFGQLADPVADKLMQLSAIGCLALNGRIDLWILALFAVKEIVLILGGLSLLKDKFVVQQLNITDQKQYDANMKDRVSFRDLEK